MPEDTPVKAEVTFENEEHYYAFVEQCVQDEQQTGVSVQIKRID